ncbi:MAG TPA: pyridoxal phosphate-dependent aminotransferase [Natronoarchaeum rubrum]|nr:pyridoxal phosphate-dependent aminotransferase [Natronoarchaeum rubrum]
MTTERSRAATALSPRILEEDLSYRTRMMGIAEGLEDVIAMGRGDPDFHTPPHIVEAAKRAIDADQHHYTPPHGLPQLREAIATNLRRFDLDYTPAEIAVTAGVQEAIMLCMLAFVDAGDEVLITSPRFTTYDTAVHLCGGTPVPVPTYERDDFALMPGEIEARITDRTKLLVLVSPNNPTGAVTPPEVIRQIAELARKHDLLVISDEIYADLVYDGAEHLSIGSLPNMKERTITLNGFSKTYAMTGWRVGYLAGPADLVEAITEPRHTLSINTSTPSQHAALAALTGPQDALHEMRNAYAERRAYLMTAFDDLGLSYGFPGGAFYLYTNVSSSGQGAADFCLRLLREGRVMIFPGAMFGDEHDAYVRVSYLQPMDRIREAVQRIGTVLASSRAT